MRQKTYTSDWAIVANRQKSRTGNGRTRRSINTEEGKKFLPIAGIAACLALLALLTFSSCSSDDDGTQAYNGATTEVCVLFAPDELGDRGYADRVLSGLNKFAQQQKALGDSTILIHFESPIDSAAQQLYLRQWADKSNNPFTGQPYQRRLLVLTTAYQVQLLGESNLAATDEVLVLNVHPSLVQSLSHKFNIYQLNISAASAARRFCDYIDRRVLEAPSYSGKDIWMLRRDATQPQADSINEVINEHYGSAADIHPLSPRDMHATANTAVASAYITAERLYSSGISYALCDWGTANTGIAYYLIMHGSASQSVFLDCEIDTGASLYIIRRFDTALCDWLSRWCKSAAGTMPDCETHGEWDGHANDNIPIE